MSLRNRRSPSGSPVEMQLPLYGTNVLIPSTTEYIGVGELGTTTPKEDAQFAIPQTGFLTSVTIQNIIAGADAAPLGLTTYNVQKNGVLIVRPAVVSPPIPAASATGTLANNSQEPLTIQIGVPVKGPAPSDPAAVPPVAVTVADLISIEVVTGAFPGATPRVRVTLNYAPGGPF